MEVLVQGDYSHLEVGLLPPELYQQAGELAAEQLDQDLYDAAYGASAPIQENSIYNFNEILDAIGID